MLLLKSFPGSFVIIGFIMLRLGLEHLQLIIMSKWIQEVTLCGLTALRVKNAPEEAIMVYVSFKYTMTYVYMYVYAFFFCLYIYSHYMICS